MSDSQAVAAAARLVRCHFDMREAVLHELTLPRILQGYLEAFCHIWRSSEAFIVLSVPGTVKISVGSVDIPGGFDAANISVTCVKQGDGWAHSCALGEHPDRGSVERWVARHGNAYDADQIWAEPAVFAIYREMFQLENKQFQAIAMIARDGHPAYSAALAAVRWARALDSDDPEASYDQMTARLKPEFAVPRARAKRVYNQARRQQRRSCPDMIPLRVLRTRGPLSPYGAVCLHLVDGRGYSMSEVGQRLGISKATVQEHVEESRRRVAAHPNHPSAEQNGEQGAATLQPTKATRRGGDKMAKKGGAPPPNGPSKSGGKSGGGRGNNPPKGK